MLLINRIAFKLLHDIGNFRSSSLNVELDDWARMFNYCWNVRQMVPRHHPVALRNTQLGTCG